jgi:hypothetical protein
MSNGAAVVENNIAVPQKLNIELWNHQTISFSGMYIPKNGKQELKHIWTPMFTVALFIMAKR